MTRIPVHTVESAPEGSRDTLKALQAKFGMVLNIHGAMAHAPAVLETYAAIQEALQDAGTFDAKTREAIALAVANVDACNYCQAAHTAGGKAAGLSVQDTLDIRRGQVADPKLGALLSLVREQTANVGHVQDSTWQAALDAGWTTTELTETSAVVALNLFTNYFNHLVGTELDLPAAPSL
ncbi:MAG: carboxymuconolactone decarboxylase family protein [Mycobacteriales bacterium]